MSYVSYDDNIIHLEERSVWASTETEPRREGAGSAAEEEAKNESGWAGKGRREIGTRQLDTVILWEADGVGDKMIFAVRNVGQ